MITQRESIIIKVDYQKIKGKLDRQMQNACAQRKSKRIVGENG